MQDGERGENQGNEPGWVFNPSSQTTPDQASDPAPQGQVQPDEVELSDAPLVSWTASEYQANPKSAGWFGSLALASILLAVLLYVFTRDLVSTVVIAIVGVIVGVFGARQPRVLQYHLDERGVYIEQKFYPYTTFKSFSIGQDQAMHYISLLSLRRFMPPLTIHFDPADEEAITKTLANYLPYEEHKQDIVDTISRRIRL